jgi:hypothetical protein
VNLWRLLCPRRRWRSSECNKTAKFRLMCLSQSLVPAPLAAQDGEG